MANQFHPPIDIGFIDSKRATPDANSGPNADANYTTNFGELESIRTIRTALNTYDPKTYPAAVLNTMTVNDMVFAWRQTSSLLNAKGISDYMLRQGVQP